MAEVVRTMTLLDKSNISTMAAVSAVVTVLALANFYYEDKEELRSSLTEQSEMYVAIQTRLNEVERQQSLQWQRISKNSDLKEDIIEMKGKINFLTEWAKEQR